MKYTLPVLPYEDDALEPIISRETIEVHYRRHEQNYLNKLNAFKLKPIPGYFPEKDLL